MELLKGYMEIEIPIKRGFLWTVFKLREILEISVEDDNPQICNYECRHYNLKDGGFGYDQVTCEYFNQYLERMQNYSLCSIRCQQCLYAQQEAQNDLGKPTK